MFPELQSRFGMAVRLQRKQLSLSQEELAERAGLHRTYVADVERGARNLSLASIQKLAHALDISLPVLFSRTIDTADQLEEGEVEILLVDPNPNDVKLTLKAFKDANMTNQVHVVRDGVEALEFVFCTGRYARRDGQKRPYVILLELKLPNITGLEVLRQIKASQVTRAIPVVVLTGSQRQEDQSESLQLGAEACLMKPVDFTRFAALAPRLKLCWALLHLASAVQS